MNRRLVLALAGAAWSACALGQMMPGQGMGGGMGGGGMGRPSMNQPGNEIDTTPRADKPDAAALKFLKTGNKSLDKAKAYESAAAAAASDDKRAAALEKMNDAYGRALDQFTEALSNNGSLFEAWNAVGFIHLRLGAYGESVDDYNHALGLKADSNEAVLHRAEAYLGVDRLEEAKAAYMDLFNHARPMANELMTAMQRWVERRKSDAGAVRPSDVSAFGKWVEERDGIARQTASLPQ